MKKTFLYVFAAVVLGVGVMLFPYLTFFMKYNESPVAYADGIPYPKPLVASGHWEEYVTTQRGGLPGFEGQEGQAQTRDMSLQMLTVGVVAALAVYLIVRRRIPRPMPPFTFPRA